MNLLAAFVLGLAGSLHCAVMCGPLVLAVNAARRQNLAQPVTRFYTGDIPYNLAYHGGRFVAYSFLGAISGLIGAAAVFAGVQRWVSIAAGCLILLGTLTPLLRFSASPRLPVSASPRLRVFRAIAAGCLILLGTLTSLRLPWGRIAAKGVSAAKTAFGRLLRNPAFGAVALLGGLNGLLPCGLVYVACAAAATAGSCSGGVATMLAFGLGTAPMMLSMGLAAKAVRWGNPLRLRRVVFCCLTAAGVLLIVRGLSLGIPYLSPDLSPGDELSCNCHHTL